MKTCLKQFEVYETFTYANTIVTLWHLGQFHKERHKKNPTAPENLNYILGIGETLFKKFEITVDCYFSQKILLKSDLV